MKKLLFVLFIIMITMTEVRAENLQDLNLPKILPTGSVSLMTWKKSIKLRI